MRLTSFDGQRGKGGDKGGGYGGGGGGGRLLLLSDAYPTYTRARAREFSTVERKY